MQAAEVHIESMELNAVECASSESENTDEEFERHAAGSEDSTDEGRHLFSTGESVQVPNQKKAVNNACIRRLLEP